MSSENFAAAPRAAHSSRQNLPPPGKTPPDDEHGDSITP
jgi:hypothetical protein